MNPEQQSKALRVLFFAETWERFSFYGMRALLVLYMTKHFKFDDTTAFSVYGSYTALVYMTPLIGGLLADKLLGARKAVVCGGLLMAAGHFAMAFDTLFYWALALLICGNGMFKPNISTIVGRVFHEKNSRRDRAFYIFYMGINLGALAAGGCGWLGENFGWHVGFGLAGVGMLVGLVGFVVGQKSYEGAADPPDPVKLREPFLVGLSRERLVYLGTLAAVAAAWFMVQPGRELGSLLSAVCALTLAGMIVYMVTRAEREERWPMFVAIVLTLFSCVFFSFFEQAGSSITLFTDRNVDRTVLGVAVPASVFSASINPAFVLLFAPFFIWLWGKLGRYEPTTPLKFGLGVIQLGLGFGALWLGARESQQTGMVPLFWLVLGYLLHTTGELCVSPVGLSMITKLSPAKIVGVMMGGWFLASSAAQYAAALIAQLTDVSEVKEVAGAVPPSATVMVYGSVFGVIALTALVTGALMCAVAPLLARRMGGVR